MTVATYDAKAVQVVFGGFTMSGFAKDSKVDIEFDENAWTKQIGVDGEGTRSKTNNQGAKITVKLMQSSKSNDILSGIEKLDRMTNSGALPLMIKDSSGNSLYLCESAWIAKHPKVEFSVDAGPREWLFETDMLVAFTGHN